MLYWILNLLYIAFYVLFFLAYREYNHFSTLEIGHEDAKIRYAICLISSIPVTLSLLWSIFEIHKIRHTPFKVVGCEVGPKANLSLENNSIWFLEIKNLLKKHRLSENFTILPLLGYQGFEVFVVEKKEETSIYISELFINENAWISVPSLLAITLHKKRVRFNESKIMLRNLFAFAFFAVPVFLGLGHLLFDGNNEGEKKKGDLAARIFVVSIGLVIVLIAYRFLLRPVLNAVTGLILRIFYSKKGGLYKDFNELNIEVLNPELQSYFDEGRPFSMDVDSYTSEFRNSKFNLSYLLDPFSSGELMRLCNKTESFNKYNALTA